MRTNGFINIIVLGFIVVLFVMISICAIYFHTSISLYNVRSDLFYITQNSLVNFSKNDLGLESYTYNKAEVLNNINYLISEHYNDKTINGKIIKKIEVMEFDFLDKDTKCDNYSLINDEKIHVKVKVFVVPQIFKKYLKPQTVIIHEDFKFSLMEI